jgi:hypothetical protein
VYPVNTNGSADGVRLTEAQPRRQGVGQRINGFVTVPLSVAPVLGARRRCR